MDVGRTEGSQGPERIQGPKRVSKTSPSTSSSKAPTDSVEISDMARMVSEVLSLPQVRQEKIQQIRELIDSGEFDTPERLKGAIDHFLEENQDLFA